MDKEQLGTGQEVQRPLEFTEIQTITNEIRRQFESREVDDGLLRDLYQQYNPEVENIELFIQRAKDLFPHLNCGLATVYLRERLQAGRIINGRYKNENHTFLLLGEETGTIVDITADQYDGPAVYIGPIQSSWSLKPMKDKQEK